MRRIVLGFLTTATVVVLLFGYHTSTHSRRDTGSGVAAPIGGSTGTGTPPPAAPSAPSSAPSPAAPAPSSGGSGSAAERTVTGDAADTRYGPVQVQVTVAGGKLTAVRVVDYPRDTRRDEEINAQALPVLVQETLSAQSARIDMVSGATYTSDGYITSLQSALDKAGF